MRKTLIGVLAIALVGSFAIGCEDEEDAIDDVVGGFDDFDVDGDDVISQSEWDDGIDDWDLDDDGLLEEDEFPMDDDDFEDMDVDDDAAVTVAEWDDAFDDLDDDADGFIDEAEFF